MKHGVRVGVFAMNQRDRIIQEIVDAFFNDIIKLDEDTCFEISDP